MHALRSAELYPEAIGDDAILQFIVLYIDNLLGTRSGAPVAVLGRPYYILPRTHRAIVVACPMSATVVRLKQPIVELTRTCLLYTSPSPRDAHESRMPSSA